jgi:hypothetical protein
MADDVTVDNGSLTDYTVASDDVAGKQYQRVKLDVGGDGATVPVEGHVPVGGVVVEDVANAAYTANGDPHRATFTPTGAIHAAAAVDITGAAVSDGRTFAQHAELRTSDYNTQSAPLRTVGYVYNGSQYDRQRGDITNGLDVDVTRVQGTVNVADGGSSLTIDGTVSAQLLTGNSNIGEVDVASSVLPTGAATSAKQDTIIGHVDGIEGLLTTIDGDTGALAGTVSGNELQVDVLTVPSPLSTAGNGTAAAAHRVTIASDSTGVIAVTDNGGSLTVDGTVAVTGTFWQATQPVSGTFFQATQPVSLAATVVTKQRADTATLSNVASSATSVTILATNTGRLGCSIQNDSTEVLYLKFGTTASSTSYTVKMSADAHYEVPFGYTGRIDGIWASANGNARVTELT